MTPSQIRHCKSMAKKISQHAQRIVDEMSNLECMSTKSLETIPVDIVINRFTHDSGIGVKDSINTIEAVIKDMLNDLKES